MGLSDRQDWTIDGELASKYEVFEVLGEGGMGRVLRARHRQLKRPVAIKLLQHGLRGSEAATRFLREARAAAQIRSPHVAQVMDASVLPNGQPYIVMEYLEGKDLAQHMSEVGRLPVQQAVDYLLQALQAIAEAHALGIVHRDLKPGNLFATRVAGGETFIKVLDFGLAKTSHAIDSLDPGVTERGAVLGTPSYMAPEQFVDAQDVDARADVWALGATLFTLVVGRPPFHGVNLPQLYTAVMHRPIPLLRSACAELPEALENVIARCLARERDQRYASVGELARALEAFASPGSSRESVERIWRVVSVPAVAIVDEAAPPLSAADVVERELVSSVFARQTTQRSPHGRRWQRRGGAALVVIVSLAIAGLSAWVRRGEKPTQTSMKVAAATAVIPITPTNTAVSPSESQSPEVAPEVTPAPAATPSPSPPKPRPMKRKIDKTGAPPATPPAPPSIYEQYP